MKYSKMKAWVKALRSGEFIQNEGVLAGYFDEDDGCNLDGKIGHCCLGVLGKVSKIPKYKLLGTEILEDTMMPACGLRTEDGQPVDKTGNKLTKAVKFRVKKEGKTETRSFDSLAMANDSGISFKRIATWIEKNYKSL